MTPADAQFLFSAIATIGAALGAVGITVAETLYARALSDGKLEECEKRYIRATFWTLSWGMTAVLAGNVGLIAVEYFANAPAAHVLTAPFWFSLLLACVVIGTGWMLALGRVNWIVGSSLALTSWWGIFLLSVYRDLPYTFTMLFIAFALAYALVFGAFSMRHAFSRVHLLK